MQDKPIKFNARITIPNKAYLEEIKLLYKAESISEVFRKLLHNSEELFRNNIDIHDIHTVKKIIKEM